MKRPRWASPLVIVALTALPGLVLPGLCLSSIIEAARLRGRVPPQIAEFGEANVEGDRVAVYLFGEKLRQLTLVPERASSLSGALADHRWAQDAIRFELPRRSREALERDLPYSGEVYQKAYVWERGVRLPARLRHRGNTLRHWFYPRRSLKARTKKSRMVRGRRDLSFTIKEPARLTFVQAVADRSGLLAPKVDLVRVFVNGRLRSVMAAVEEIDETFLLAHRRMPGDVYKGENWFETNEYHYGSPAQWLFRDAGLWSKKALDNTRPPAARPELERLTRLAASPEPEALRELATLIDRDALRRHWAYKLLLDDFHQSDTNNQRLYLDPTTGRFYPVVWDPLVRDNAGNLKDLRRVNRLMHFRYSPSNLPAPYHRLGADPRFVHEVLQDFLDGLPSQASLDKLAAELRVLAERADLAEASAEPHPLFSLPTSQIDESHEILRANRARLEALLRGDARVVWRPSPGGVWVGAQGLGGVDLRSLDVECASLPSAAPIQDLDRDGTLSSSDRSLAGTWEQLAPGRARFVFAEPLRVLPAYTGINRLLPVPLAHPLLLPPGSKAEGLAATNALTDAEIPALELSVWGREDVDAEHPWDLLLSEGPPPPAELVLSHPVHRISEDLVIPRGQTLRIRPGTQVLVSPGVNVICRGRLLAEGSPEAPIRWGPAEATKPWGVLALQGPGASGSALRWLEIHGGSRARVAGVRYPGMVTIHHARDLQITDCAFSQNHVGDDALRLAYSVARIERCLFRDVRSDALDMDYSSGLVTQCRFERVGNDGVDLMRSSPRVVNNTFRGCGDKGISIGEGSEPLVADSTLEDCEVGIQIKDASEPLLLHLEIRHSGTGVLVSRKNWRYARGGSGWLARSVVEGNREDLRVEADSRLSVTACRIGAPPKSSAGILSLGTPPAGEDSGPLPPSPAYGLLANAPKAPRVGALGLGPQAWRLRPLLRDQRFPDGFRLVAQGWFIRHEPLYIQHGALVAKANPNAPLVWKSPELKRPAGSRIHLLVSAEDPCTLRVEGGGVQGEPALLDAAPRWITRALKGDLDELRLTPSRGTRLRLHRYLESRP